MSQCCYIGQGNFGIMVCKFFCCVVPKDLKFMYRLKHFWADSKI